MTHNARLVCLADVKAERVEWLWKGRIPRGKLTLLDGDPGVGKSTVTLDIAARVSTGKEMPDGSTGSLGRVLLLGDEDGLADTIRARLDAAEADCSRIFSVAAIRIEDGERRAVLPDDIGAIEDRLKDHGDISLLIIDPLVAYLVDEVNSHRDQHVRRALAPLAQMAEQTGCAVIMVRHLNKGGGSNALYRGGGSIGIIGASRSAMFAAVDPDDDSRRVLAMSKANLSAPVPALGYRQLQVVLPEPDEFRRPIETSRIEWLGATEHTAASLNATPADPAEKSALDDAKDFLLDLLEPGPVEAKQGQKKARDAGISERTLGRAKASLSVRSTKREFQPGAWEWSLRR